MDPYHPDPEDLHEAVHQLLAAAGWYAAAGRDELAAASVADALRALRLFGDRTRRRRAVRPC